MSPHLRGVAIDLKPERRGVLAAGAAWLAWAAVVVRLFVFPRRRRR